MIVQDETEEDPMSISLDSREEKSWGNKTGMKKKKKASFLPITKELLLFLLKETQERISPLVLRIKSDYRESKKKLP